MTGRGIRAAAVALVFGAVLGAWTAPATAQQSPLQDKPWHTADGFRNLDGAPERDIPFSAYLEFSWERLQWAAAAPEIPEGHVLPAADAVAALADAGDADAITWIGHATFLIRLGGTTILTDPFLMPRASPANFIGPKRFAPPGIPLGDLPPIDVIVLSHNHYDSLDTRTLAALPNKATTAVVAPLGLGATFVRLGFERVHELDWFESAEIAGVTVTALPARHWSRRGIGDENRTLWMGASIAGSGQRIYFSGDTAYAPYFADLGAQYGPFDYGIVGIGAYEPRAMMQYSHTTPEEAVDLALDMGAGTVVAMHWGTVQLGIEPPFEAPDRFRARARSRGMAADRAWVLAIGETRLLP